MKQQKETRSLNIDNEFLIFALYYPVLLFTSNQLNEKLAYYIWYSDVFNE